MAGPPNGRIARAEVSKAVQVAAGPANESCDRWTPLLNQRVGPATEVMLDMARVGLGSRVLDVTAGAGDQTLMAARRRIHTPSAFAA